jgi:hypothetical protein
MHGVLDDDVMYVCTYVCQSGALAAMATTGKRYLRCNYMQSHVDERALSPFLIEFLHRRVI